jgi:hypothetical protein
VSPPRCPDFKTGSNSPCLTTASASFTGGTGEH